MMMNVPTVEGKNIVIIHSEGGGEITILSEILLFPSQFFENQTQSQTLDEKNVVNGYMICISVRISYLVGQRDFNSKEFIVHDRDSNKNDAISS